MAHDVFISYKSDDYSTATHIRERLESEGIGCWLAPDCIEGGKSYAQQIPNAIRNAKVAVVLLSSASMNSIWVAREVDRAVNENKRVMPFVLEDVPLTDEFTFYLTNVQQYPAYRDFDGELDRMVRDIRSCLGMGEGDPAAKPVRSASGSGKNTASGTGETPAPKSEGEGKKHYCRFLPPGFRSLNIAHMIPALFMYVVLIVLAVVLRNSAGAPFCVAFVIAALAAISYAGNYLGFRNAFRLERIKKKWLRILVGILCGVMIYFIVFWLVILIAALISPTSLILY